MGCSDCAVNFILLIYVSWFGDIALSYIMVTALVFGMIQSDAANDLLLSSLIFFCKFAIVLIGLALKLGLVFTPTL